MYDRIVSHEMVRIVSYGMVQIVSPERGGCRTVPGRFHPMMSMWRS